MTLFSSCFRNHNTAVYVSDDETEYEISVSYEKKKARKLLRYLKHQLQDDHNFQTVKITSVDKKITLNDKTRFYLYSYPGELEIKIDKSENSEASFIRIRNICEEIKVLIADD